MALATDDRAPSPSVMMVVPHQGCVMHAHARLAFRNLQFTLRNTRTLGLAPGAARIRGRAAQPH